MNTTRSVSATGACPVGSRCRGRAVLPALSLFGALLLGCVAPWHQACGGLPEPDTIVYGTVSLDGMPITAAHTGVVVEARRSISGPAVASCRMGADPATGDIYVLRLSIESSLPLLDPLASLVGDSLFLVVTDASGFRGQTAYTLTDRGVTERRDLSFGSVTADSDQDGLPDAWELAQLGGLGSGLNTVMANGQTAQQNYIAGTNPNDPASVFEVLLSVNGSQLQVSFQARKAEGAGYEGRSRYYSLESAADLNSPWQGVPGFTNVLGNNQAVTLSHSATNPPAFYRGRVWLQ